MVNDSRKMFGAVVGDERVFLVKEMLNTYGDQSLVPGRPGCALVTTSDDLFVNLFCHDGRLVDVGELVVARCFLEAEIDHLCSCWEVVE